MKTLHFLFINILLVTHMDQNKSPSFNTQFLFEETHSDRSSEVTLDTHVGFLGSRHKSLSE